MHSATHPPRYQLATETIAWIARGLVMALLLVAPWPYGMAEWGSQQWLVPVVGAILLLSSLVALARRVSVGNPVVWSLAAVLLVGILQVVPLPTPLWKILSPVVGFQQQVEELAADFAMGVTEEGTAKSDAALAENSATAAADDPLASLAHTISIHPLQTRTTACVFAMGLAMLISAGILFRDRLSVTLLLSAISVSGVSISLLGIYQLVAAGDWTYLGNMRETSFGTFYSRNSAPQFFACAFAATVGLLALYHAHQTKQQLKMEDKRYRIVYPSVNLIARLRRRAEQFVTEADLITVICLIVMSLLAISILAANSRGGTLAFMITGLLIIAVYAMGRQAGWSAAVVILLVAVGSGLFLSLFGIDELIGTRMDTISEEFHERDNARLSLWKLAFSQPSCWALGSGLGTFHLALLPDYPEPSAVQFAHAENIYVELASGAGVVTLLIALSGLGWLVWQLLTSYSNSNTAKATRFACLFALLAVGLQNMFDFSLMLPSIFLPLAALIGCYFGTRHHVRKKVRVKSSEHTSHSHSHSHSHSQSHSSRLPADQRQRYAAQFETAASSLEHSESSTHARSASSLAEAPWAPATLIVCLLLISCAVAMGYRPLAAFAFAEQLRQTEPEIEGLPAFIEAADGSQWGTFPETHLEIGRLRQYLAQQQIFSSTEWPAELNRAMRQSLSRPHFFSAVFHGTQDPQLVALHEFLVNEPAALENLSDSQFDMRAAMAACPLDWRASWGLMRADMGEMSALERRRNYARILLTCRASIPDLQEAGTHALMIGETSAGLRIWRDVLPVSYWSRYQIIPLVDRFLTPQQLVGILPDNPLRQIEMAKFAIENHQLPDVSQAILDSIDLDLAFSTAESESHGDWPLVAWATQQKGTLNQQIEAWKRAVLEDPLNHANSYSLALVFERAGRYDDALERIDDALQRSSDNAVYEALKVELQAKVGVKE